MKRPMTDFYSDREIEKMYMLTTLVQCPCFACEQPIGQSHYRLTSTTQSTTSLICAKCAISLKRQAMQRRRPMPQPARPHFDPLTKDESQQDDKFVKPGMKGQRR